MAIAAPNAMEASLARRSCPAPRPRDRGGQGRRRLRPARPDAPRPPRRSSRACPARASWPMDYAGVDPILDGSRCGPGAHYHMGASTRTRMGRRSFPRLYAAGECACVSVHGANRLGGNSLMETIVFGRRSGKPRGREAWPIATARLVAESAVRDADARSARSSGRQAGGERPWQVREEAGDVHVRRRRGLPHGRAPRGAASPSSATLRERVPPTSWSTTPATASTPISSRCSSSRAMLEMGPTALTWAGGARAHGVARAHTRLDHPDRDDAKWMKHRSVVRPREGGLDYKPVTVTAASSRWCGATERRNEGSHPQDPALARGASHTTETAHGRRPRDGHACWTRSTPSRTSATARLPIASRAAWPCAARAACAWTAPRCWPARRP